MNTVWAYIAHKDGYWCGIASADMDGIGKWIDSNIRRGLTVTPVKDREEYHSALGELKCWHDSPELKAKNSKKVKR